MAEQETQVEYQQPGPSAFPAKAVFTKRLLNEKPAFMEIAVQSPSKDGLTKGANASILIPLKDWEDLQLQLMA